MPRLCAFVLVALCLFVSAPSSPAQGEAAPPAASREHVLTGAWLAKDGTVFIFRKDGTFHGYDWKHREIWGNWVVLSPTRIGFQSLMHDGAYRPQYAIIRPSDKDAMDYIVTGGTAFIRATRLPVDKAEAVVEIVVEPQVHHPEEAQHE